MKKDAVVKEPIQIYIASDERRLLDRLATETGLSRAEILRQGLRSFAAQRAGEGGPVQTLMRALREYSIPGDMAVNHDEYLAAAYKDRHNR